MPYKIIGANSREYGPVDIDEIREWIDEGRADANTLVCEVDGNQWIKLRDLPDVAGALPKMATARPKGMLQINYLVPAILCTLFCCLPFGIAGILFAVQANSKVQQGDIDGAAPSPSGRGLGRGRTRSIFFWARWNSPLPDCRLSENLKLKTGNSALTLIRPSATFSGEGIKRKVGRAVPSAPG